MAISTVNFNDINKFNEILIPNYQRGYRWTENQINTMVKDISEAKGPYCMQSIVVKKNKKNSIYTVIDGQQRLTTLKLIYDEIDDESLHNNYLNIKYESSSEVGTYRAIDDRYIQAAKTVIKSNSIFKKEEKCKELKEKIDDLVFFILFEVDENKNGNEIFNTLNTGKIPLTDIELIKARILLSMSDKTETQKDVFIKEWYDIESTLQDDNFWGFIAGNQINNFSSSGTRIDYLFSLYYEKSTTYEPLKMYRKFEDAMQTSDAVALWKKIASLFNKAKILYEDKELFLLTGTIIESRSINIDQLVNEIKIVNPENFNIGPLRKGLSDILKASIVSYIDKISSIQYGEDERNSIKNILFVSNMLKYLKVGYERKDIFYKYHKTSWDIEHISSQTFREMNTEDIEAQSETIKTLCWYYKDNKLWKEIYTKIFGNKEIASVLIKSGKSLVENFKNIISSNLISNDFDKDKAIAFIKAKIEHNKPLDEIHMNSIGNLTLLDSNTNRGYGNSFYFVKCKKIHERIDGGVLILPFTQKNFSKSLNSDEVLWDIDCVEIYKKELMFIFKEYIEDKDSGILTKKYSDIKTMGNKIEKYGFNSLLKKFYKVSIPGIQRDYVQGNDSKKAAAFIIALIKSTEDSPLDLNFIYGSIDDKNDLIPLDGQQRLTTLFLLDYYLFLKENGSSNGNIKKLEYRCREFTVDFLNFLNDLEYEDLRKAKSFNKLNFNPKLLFDPSVKSMVNMLDIIHLEVSKMKGLKHDYLFDSNAIIFNFLELNDYGLTDELYLKMNSRGKQLTDYEILKNKLLQVFDNSIQNISYNLDVDSFSKSLDNKWSNYLLLNYIKNLKNKNSESLEKSTLKVDDIEFNLIYLISIITDRNKAVFNKIPLVQDKIEYVIKVATNDPHGLYDNLTVFFDSIYDDFLDSKTKAFTYFISENDKFNFKSKHSIFKVYEKLLLDGTFGDSAWSIVAIKFYLEYKKSKKEWNIEVAQYFRVVQNLYNNAAISNLPELLSAISVDAKIDTKLNIKAILEKLNTPFNSSIDNVCIKEEIKKLSLMENYDWFEKILIAEKHNYFKGQLNILFKLCSINPEDDKIEYMLEWDVIKNCLFRLFPCAGEYNEDSFTLLRKALLSYGNYLQELRNNWIRPSLIDESEWKAFLNTMSGPILDSFKKIVELYKDGNYKKNIESLIKDNIECKKEMFPSGYGDLYPSFWWRKLLINNFDELRKNYQLNSKYELYFCYYPKQNLYKLLNFDYHMNFIFLPKDGSRLGMHSELVSYCDYINFLKFMDINAKSLSKEISDHGSFVYSLRNESVDNRNCIIEIGYTESKDTNIEPYLWIYFYEFDYDFHISWFPVYGEKDEGQKFKPKKFRNILCKAPSTSNFYVSLDELRSKMENTLINSSYDDVTKSLINIILNYTEDDKSNYVPSLCILN